MRFDERFLDEIKARLRPSDVIGKTVKLRARHVDDAEKARLWPICVKHYHEYDDYQARTDRNIPVFVCEPR